MHPLELADFTAIDLSGAILRWAILPPAVFTNAIVSKADLVGAVLASVNCDGANISYANLAKADLSSATLIDANLQGTTFNGADLTNADLRGANLKWAGFRGACLVGANLAGADLRSTDFTRAQFGQTVVTEAQIGRTIFSDTDLSEVVDLATVHHHSASSVGIDTFYQSGGKISREFLQGAGIPDEFIRMWESMTPPDVPFCSCFISYSSEDREFAQHLHADLRAKKLRVWFAPEDLKIGDRFQERIEDTIRLYEKVMIILSGASVKSRWVEREVNAAREREDRDNRTVLFPIRIDDAVMDTTAPWAADLRRTRHIGDFTRWKDHNSYQKAFERLLRDLRQSEPDRSAKHG